MSRLTSLLAELSVKASEPVVTIGNFDGVHLGHRTIFDIVTRSASKRGAPSVALTFEPHPVVFFGKRAPETFCITTPEEKLKLISGQGIDHPLALPFDRELASLSPENFVNDVLHSGLGAREVWVGYDFNFGKGRAGGIEDLVKHGAARGIDVHVHEAVKLGGEVVSSTRVRKALTQTDLSGAETLLARRHFLSAPVERGDARGRTLGFPTLNISPRAGMMVPHGVYTTFVTIEETGQRLPAITNIGVRPTVKVGAAPNAESFILAGLSKDSSLYGQAIKVELLKYQRPEAKFDSVEGLKAQVQQDLATARAAHGL